MIRDYLTAVSGAGGRLVFSLVYFIALANTLTIAEFGVFATASAAGIMLSRIASFGFVSPLYRIATVKRHLIGTYTAGYLVFTLLSLPVLAAAALVVHWIFFVGDIALSVFAIIVFTEAIVWRGFEVVLIVNNGMGRFAHSAVLAILGTLIRALGAAALSVAAAPPAWKPGHGTTWLRMALRSCWQSSCSILARDCDWHGASTDAAFRMPCRSPSLKFCSISRWNSTNCWCWR